MWTYGQAGRMAAMSIALAIFSCGDDSKVPDQAGQQMEPSTPGPARCSDTNLSMDAGVSGFGQTPGAAGPATTDGLGLTLDQDAGGKAPTNGPADPSHCDVMDARYGCGIALNANWLRFKSGLEVDRRYERGWSPVFEVATRADLVAKCAGLSLPGIPAGQFKVPAITDVRTMAGGCDNTLLGSSGCRVTSGTFLPSDAGTCSCGGACVGPNQGRFCLADVPECITLWTETVCEGGPGCRSRQVWIYDVTTGAVVLTPESLNSPLLVNAKGRCFAGLPYPIP